MQPLYSVDHETRQNSCRVELQSPTPQEDTPLFHRFPQEHAQRSKYMNFSICLLFFTLIAGIVIGTYLLTLQNNAEHILPPVEAPFQLISGRQWRDMLNHSAHAPNKASQLIVMQTDTPQCLDDAACDELLQNMTMRYGNKTLPYNFLISSNGRTYEARGWNHPSLIFPKYPNSTVLAFIGNFTKFSPPKAQLTAAYNFLAKAVNQQHLDPGYVISGKMAIYEPIRLFTALVRLPHFKGQLVD